MKKRVAIFTIVKNESYFLPIWLKYYRKFFQKEDVFILDHQTTDGSTKNLEENVLLVNNNLSFDHQWLCDTVKSFQKKLLADYECVVFAEADEIIYSPKVQMNSLIENFISSDHKYLRCKGYEIVQNLKSEKNLSRDDSIINNRNYWFPSFWYDKTLISKIPLDWTPGFHNIYKNNPPIGTFDLCLCHLHRVDFEIMFKRNKERSSWNNKEDGRGGHNKCGDRESVLNFFNSNNAELQVIPEDFKKNLFI